MWLVRAPNCTHLHNEVCDPSKFYQFSIQVKHLYCQEHIIRFTQRGKRQKIFHTLATFEKYGEIKCPQITVCDTKTKAAISVKREGFWSARACVTEMAAWG